MRLTIDARLAGLIAVAVLVLPILTAAQSQTAERSRTQGLKETDQFVQAGGKTSQAVTEANLQLQTTLKAYNALVTQPSKDMKGDYKKLLKHVDTMGEKITEARTKIDAMQKTGDVYFNGRATAAKNIQDPALQTQAQDRLNANQQQFADVLQALRDAGAALEPFRKQLADHVTYLGGELSPSGTASLKPEAEKLTAQGSEVFNKVDQATGKATAYFQGIRSGS
jgi:chromosome segregation ATPase